jgi:hypothetical protein
MTSLDKFIVICGFYPFDMHQAERRMFRDKMRNQKC